MSHSPSPVAALSKSSSRVLVAGVLVVGLLISALIAQRARRDEEERILGNFREHANYQLFAARERVRLLEELVYGLRRAVASQRQLTRPEFSSICADILSRFDGVQSLQWVQAVDDADRTDVEASMRDDFGRPIRFKHRVGASDFKVAESKPSYWVIRLAEPVAPNAIVLGYDVSSAPTAADLQLAADSGELVVSHPFRLAQARSDEEAFGVIFICPVTDQVEGERVLRGFTQAVFRVTGIFASSVLRDSQNALHFHLIDDDADSARSQLLFSSRPAAAGMGPELPTRLAGTRGETVTTTIEVGGRHWRFVAVVDETWRSSQRTSLPQLIFVGGIGLTLLGVLILAGFMRRAALVDSLVREQTSALRTSEGELRAILDNSPNAIWIKDLSGRYLLVNREFCRTYDHPPEALIGRTDDFLYPADVAQSMRETDQRTTESRHHLLVEGEYDIRGEKRHFYTVKFPVHRADGETFGVGGISTDVTTVKRVESQLAETQKLESLGVLAGGIAHDFNNLLTGILGNASLITHEYPPGTETGQSARDIESAAHRAAELCRQMLAYSGRGSFVIERMDLSRAVEEMVPLLSTSIGKHTDLRLALATALPRVEVDPSQLRQIIMNLVINASEALPATGGRVSATTSWRTATSAELAEAIGRPELSAGTYVSLKVEDNGSGIAEADLRRIFEPFFTTKFTGRGLGLSAVLGIVRSHRGALFVSSQVGVGTTFELMLPALQEDRPSSAPPMPAERTYLPASAGLRVFLAEDETAVRSFIEKLLLGAGATVVSHADGDRALAGFAAHAFDLAILDLTLPGLSGQDLLGRIREQQPTLPVLMISGFSEQEAAGHCSVRRPDAFLQKPFTADALLTRIDLLRRDRG